jgi:hypothetical protein
LDSHGDNLRQMLWSAQYCQIDKYKQDLCISGPLMENNTRVALDYAVTGWRRQGTFEDETECAYLCTLVNTCDLSARTLKTE